MVPYTAPPNKGGEGDMIGLMATTLPMAAVSDGTRLEGWFNHLLKSATMNCRRYSSLPGIGVNEN